MTLAELKIGQDAVLRTIGGQGELRHHLLDMGLTPGTEVTLRKVAPMGDPIEVELRGYELTLRLADAAKIEVENVHETDRAAMMAPAKVSFSLKVSVRIRVITLSYICQKVQIDKNARPTRIVRRLFSFTAMLLLDGAVSPRNRNIVALLGRFVYNYAVIVFYFTQI